MGDTNFIESSTPMVNSVLHATKILDYYASQRREYLSLTEISRAIGLHKPYFAHTAVCRLDRAIQHQWTIPVGQRYFNDCICRVCALYHTPANQ